MEKRKPTYNSAVRMAQLVSILSQAWRPVPIELVAEQLNISLRTLQRYRKALNEQLAAGDGSSFLKVIRKDNKEMWYLTDQEEIVNANAFRIISVFVAKSLLKFMEGTVVKDTIDNIWEVVTGQMAPSKKKQLESFDKKIRYTGFGRKNYEDMDITLATILRGLIHETKLQITHYSKTDRQEKKHTIRPYTLLLHRDSLYLHAYVEGYKQIRTFTVDAIKEAVNLNEKFDYPADYNPEKLTEGSFGIYQSKDGKPEKVVVEFKEYLWDYITTRLWHPTQKFLPIKDGWFKMEFYLSDITEFIPWVLAFGKEVRVIEPDLLCDAIKNELDLAISNY
ncbi:MAG: hypothetical protein BWX92_03560 [Deltaproteobacteria bacterium ADurb.Bin135]|jgi:predicted DNA-binding transcriptional regulator YafY|nr:MAG: hypothetical protein BWX92_03560 [Deltaproteobacteria bacterium ADurb.Bin135]HOD79592.1 WYL domain-containing transcriptional regulator [Syntrophorhabdus sp.]